MYMHIGVISRLITSLRWCMLDRGRELVAMCNIRCRAERSNLLKLAGGRTNWAMYPKVGRALEL